MLAGTDGDFLPVLPALRSALGSEFHHAILGENRRNTFDAELGSFLYDEIHSFASRYALNQMHPERRLRIRLDWSPKFNRNFVLRKLDECCPIFSIVAVEYKNSVADSQPQDFSEITCFVAADREAGSRPESRVDIQSRLGHDYRV